MTTNYVDLIERAEGLDFSEADTLTEIFKRIVTTTQYIYTADDIAVTSQTYRIQAAYCFVLLVLYLRRVDALTPAVMTGAEYLGVAPDVIDEHVGDSYRSINRIVDVWELIGELASITSKLVKNQVEQVQAYHLRVVMLSLMYMLATEVTIHTTDTLANMIDEFLTERGK